MSRYRRTILGMVLGLLLLCAADFLGTQSPATAIPGEVEEVQTTPAIAEQAPAAPQAARVRELTDLRTEKSRTFELADGQREWVGFIEAVHHGHSAHLSPSDR
jgi:hypothetical protein